MKKTISIAFALFATINFAFAASSTLDAQKQKKVIERVKEYCTLMQEFSGDVEKIDNMETIFGICENSNVSVFNDLTVPSARDISANSMPLQQYMMTLTDKFENNVKTSYSGYKYLKTIVQPSPLEGFDAASYAFVKVNKQVNTGSYKAKMNLNVIVNTETMKVSSTISEDYEDPQSIYLEALTKYNEGKYEEAIPLFDKVSGLQRFSGRNRAKTMLGWIYADRKEYQKANDLLSESSTEDPLGGVIWASKLLLNDNVPANLINNTKGIKILKELSGTKDKDIPIMHLIAASALAESMINFQTYTSKIYLSDEDANKIETDLISDPNTSDIFKMKGYWLHAFQLVDADTKEALNYINKAEEFFQTSNLDQQDFEKWDVQLSYMKMALFFKMGDSDKAVTLMQTMMEKPYAACCLARLFLSSNNYPEALAWFKKAAENNDAFSCYIISLSCLPMDNYTTYGKYVEQYYIDLLKREILGVENKTWRGFIRYLFTEQKLERSSSEFLKWNQKAIELGDVYAMEDRAFYEVLGDMPGLERNIPHSTTLSCDAAYMGIRKQNIFLTSTHYAALEIEAPDKPSYKETDTYRILKTLDEQGNGAASYLLYLDHMFLPAAKDSVKAMEYLERSKDARYYSGMLDFAINLMNEQQKLDQAFVIFEQLTDYPKSGAYSFLGTIEGRRENYLNAMKYFLIGVERENDYLCYEGLSTLYQNGLGCKKDLNRALKLIKAALGYYQLNIDLSEESSEYKRLNQKQEELENLIAEEGGNNTNSYITQLNQLLDNSISADERINKSQKLLKEIFASPKAVVKTVGSNGKTVVSTETAEDFLLRLATMPTDKKLVEVSSKKDKNGKYTELTVQMK